MTSETTLAAAIERQVANRPKKHCLYIGRQIQANQSGPTRTLNGGDFVVAKDWLSKNGWFDRAVQKRMTADEFLNKSASQKINKRLNIEQVNEAIAVNICFRLKFPSDDTVNEWRDVKQVDDTVQVNVAN